MTVFLCAVIILLILILLVLAITFYNYVNKSTFITDKEKGFIKFTFDIFENYANDLGIQSIEEHKKICDELNKIKEKHLK